MTNDMDFYWLVLGILSTWRVTHLLQAEDGPWDMVIRLRRLAGSGFVGAMLDCFACLSLWISIIPAWYLARDWQHGALLWTAFSAGAMLLQKMTERRTESEALPEKSAAYFIEEE